MVIKIYIINSLKNILKDLEMNLIDLNELVFKKENNPYDLFHLDYMGIIIILAQKRSQRLCMNLLANKL